MIDATEDEDVLTAEELDAIKAELIRHVESTKADILRPLEETKNDA